MTLRAIESPLQENIREARAALEAAADAGYESVVIFGFKDGYVHRSYSGCLNYLEKVGALEEAKQIYMHGLGQEPQK